MAAETDVTITKFPLYIPGVSTSPATTSGEIVIDYNRGNGTGSSADTVARGDLHVSINTPIPGLPSIDLPAVFTFSNFTGSTINGVTTLTGSIGGLPIPITATLVYSGNNPSTARISIAVEGITIISGQGPVSSTYTPCFVRGTHVRTPDGERRVEDLRIGDLVVTSAGEAKPIIWIGTRSYGRTFAQTSKTVCPVRIAAGAIADGLPTRDLLVSPCHAVLVDGLLIPARWLVNGITITQGPIEAQVDYFHLELEQHDIVIAEGVPAETFVDDHGRLMFHNADEYFALYPHREAEEAIYATARVDDGEELEAVRTRLAARAKQTVAAVPRAA